MLKDIRELKNDPEAYAAELERRWTGLLSYRYIGRNHSSMNTGPEDNTVTLRRDMRNAAGGLLVAPLAISAPEGNVGPDTVTVPNPVILSVQILDPARDVTRIEVVESELLHLGARMGYSRSKIVDSPDLPPLWKAFGASRRDDGHWSLPALSVELASPDAALHIGPQHVLLETAAIDLAADLVGTDMLQMQTWHVMHLSRGKVGPFRVDGSAVRAAGGRVGVRLTLHDEGNDDRAVTSASAVLAIVE